jgi:predicted AAA+ superfamily ATPase
MEIGKLYLPTELKMRPVYLDKVVPYIGKQILKVFTGQRRVGKSYLLFQLMKHIDSAHPNAPILYINKEDLQFSSIKNALDLNAYVQQHRHPSAKTFVFIDEIQEIEDFVGALRSLALDPQLDIYCTGSNANLLSSDVAGYLSGRALEFTVQSLSYTEFLDFHGFQNSDASVELYLKYGGLPYLMNLDLRDDIVFEYLKNMYQVIVYRDIINRYEVRNAPFLDQLIRFLADTTGSLFSARKISEYLKSQGLKIPVNQVLLYIDYLTNAFIIHKVPRYDIKGKRLFESGDKYYFENLGIRNGIQGYQIADRGKIVENAVYNHLIFQGYDVKVGVLGDREIDFVCYRAGEMRYVQVALTIQSEDTMKREFGNLIQIDDHYPKEVVTLDAISMNSYEGVRHVHLREFLS